MEVQVPTKSTQPVSVGVGLQPRWFPGSVDLTFTHGAKDSVTVPRNFVQDPTGSV